MAIEHIKETDTLNQGRQKINEIMDQSNQSVQKVDDYSRTLEQGIKDAKQIAVDAGDDAKQIAQNAGTEANQKADQAVADSKTAVETANRAVGTANQNKQEFDTLRNEFDELVAESGDSNPEIVQARTDTEGIKQPTLQARLTRDFGNRLTTADAIQLFSGSVNTPKMMDFSGKTAGNLATNPHQGYSDYTAATLKKPAAAWNEVNQDAYNKLAARDDSGVSTGSTQNGVIPQQLYKFDVIKAIEQIAPTVFTGKSLEESIQLVKMNFVSFTLALRGKATSPNNKNLKVATYLESTDSYSTQLQSAAQEYTDFTTEINDRNFIDSKGKINVLVYSDSSNGVTSSNIDIDYVGVQIVVSLNPLEVLESSGFAKSEKVTNQLKQHTDDKNNPHSVTKSQVGLGSVPNYGAATDAEALLGTVTNKVMTPKNVKDTIEAQSVLLEGNQDINGKKNYTSIPSFKDIDMPIPYTENNTPDAQNAYQSNGKIYLGGEIWLGWSSAILENSDVWKTGQAVQLGSGNYPTLPLPSNMKSVVTILGYNVRPNYYGSAGFGSFQLVANCTFNGFEKPHVFFIKTANEGIKKILVTGALLYRGTPPENPQAAY